ncbi:MAG: aspartate kinase [Clostridioides sp.]|jgi:aspartate kinase|nr:aspartate kinase [Clostridioides sp.]
MSILVQKFGGTSVESFEKMEQICEIVKKEKIKGTEVVLVVSAMGRKGAPYATDTLIGLISHVSDNPRKRELDTIMSCGEIISGTILASMLTAKGIEAEFLTGSQAGILTTSKYSDARVKYINTKRILKGLSEGKVVVIAGFQGVDDDGETMTLGRGGSDTSAVAIGKALECELVEIYTDVDGIMTADPRVVPEANIMDFINYEEVFQMADKGAKVIHPRAVQLAQSANMTLVIKNTMNPDYKGTRIGGIEDYNGEIEEFEEEEDIKVAVAHKGNIAQVRICAEGIEFTEVLDSIEAKGISIDMINFFVSEKDFVVDEGDVEELKVVLDGFNLKYEILKGCAKVTLIGSQIVSVPGIMSKIVRGLSKDGISLLQTSDSHMTISCLVASADMERAVHSIHEEFYKKK